MYSKSILIITIKPANAHIAVIIITKRLFIVSKKSNPPNVNTQVMDISRSGAIAINNATTIIILIPLSIVK